MMDNKNSKHVPSSPFQSPWVINIIWLVVCILSAVHSALITEPLSLLYLSAVSLFFLILILFLFSFFRKNSNLYQANNVLIIYLIIYILLITWLDLNKTLPEYKAISNFEEKRADLIYRLALNERSAENRLASLYLNADDTVNRIEPSVKHKGALMMDLILKEKIEANQGNLYVEDMYQLAEISFANTGPGFALTWYQNAHKYGKKDALQRYDHRMKESGW